MSGAPAMYSAAIAFWALFLIAAIFYAQHARHPGQRPFAAYLIFVCAFSMAAFAFFVTGVILLHAAGAIALLDEPAMKTAYPLAVITPAFFVARWQLRKPPRTSYRS